MLRKLLFAFGAAAVLSAAGVTLSSGNTPVADANSPTGYERPWTSIITETGSKVLRQLSALNTPSNRAALSNMIGKAQSMFGFAASAARNGLASGGNAPAGGSQP